MSVFGEQAFLELKALTKGNSNDILALSNTVEAYHYQTSNSLLQLDTSIGTTNGNVATLSTNVTDNTAAITNIGTVITDINSQLGSSNQAISLRLLITDYNTAKDNQNQYILNNYLSKEEFANYNITKDLAAAAQSFINTALNSAITEVQSTVLVLGASFISGTFVLGNEVVNTVDDAFLNLEGRIINNSNSIVAINNQFPATNTLIDTKADQSIVTLSNVRYDTALSNIGVKFNNYHTAEDTDMLLSYKVNGSIFNTLKTDVALSNIQYEADIIAAQDTATQALDLALANNDGITSLNAIKTDLSLFNILNTDVALSNIRYDSLSNTVITSLTSLSNSIVATNSNTYTKGETDTFLNDKLNASAITNYYTQTQTNTLLSDKLNSSVITNYYTQTQTDTLLNYKLNSNELSNYLTPYSTKIYVDNAIAALPSTVAVVNTSNIEIMSINALTLSIANTQSLTLLNRAVTGNYEHFDRLKRGTNQSISSLYDTISFITSSNIIGTDYNALTLFKNTTNATLALKTDLSLFNTLNSNVGLSNIRYDTTKTDLTLFNTLNSNVGLSNIRYDNALGTKTDLTLFNTLNSNVGLSNVRYDTTLGTKANQATTYTKTEADTLLFTKLDKTVAVSDYATKTYVINSISTNQALAEPLGANSFILSITSSMAVKLFNTALTSLTHSFYRYKSGANSMLKTAFETIQTINDSLSIIRSRTPVGSIIQFAGELLPTGFLLCDGSALLRSEYTDLFNVISVTWGSGDNSTTFNIPDLRNRFLRSSGTISGAVGTLQADSVKSHSHTSSLSAAGAHSHSATIYDGGSHGHSGSTGNAGNHSHQVPGVQNSILGNNSGFVFRAGMESVGNYTVNSTGNHAHSLNINEGGQHNHGIAINSDGAHSHSLTIDAFGDAETRPLSATVLYCIRY